MASNQNAEGSKIRYTLPRETKTQLVKVSPEVKGQAEYNSEYFVLAQSFKKEVIDANRLNF